MRHVVLHVVHVYKTTQGISANMARQKIRQLDQYINNVYFILLESGLKVSEH